MGWYTRQFKGRLPRPSLIRQRRARMPDVTSGRARRKPQPGTGAQARYAAQSGAAAVMAACAERKHE